MKKIIFSLTACFFLALPVVCLGGTGWYGSVNAGVAIMPDSDVAITELGTLTAELSYDTGFVVGGAVGYMMEKFRFEGEVSYQTSDIESLSIGGGGSESLNGDISAVTFLVNGYFDFATGGPLTPYITAGIGYSNFEVNIQDVSDDDNLFTYQLGAGVGYSISETVILDLRYRYLGFDDYEYSEVGVGSIGIEAASHNISAGLRFAF